MKNISRRVFIKGLAVAGVAAAASTVLAGCNTNMIPGVDDGAEDPSEEPSTNSNTLSFADPVDPSKTVSITLSNMVVDDSRKDNTIIKFDAKVVNKNLGNVFFNNAKYGATTNKITAAQKNDFVVVLSAFPDNNEGNTASFKAAAGTGAGVYVNNVINATVGSLSAFSTTATETKNGCVYFTLAKAENLDWSKITVQMKPYKIANASASKEYALPLNTLKYTFNK